MAETKAAAGTRTVQNSVTIGIESATMDNLNEAQTFVGAPGTATLALQQLAPTYVTDENGNSVPTDYPHQVTFTWTEQK